MKKILIAEDNADLQYIFGMTFNAQEFDVRMASDGEEVIERLQAELPDILLLDINMPKKSGLEVLSYIRCQDIASHMKIIVVTGNYLAQQSPETDVADLFLVKPVGMKELLTLARRLL